MSPEQFLYWLQGFAELSGDTPPTPEQWKSIREHLATCFHKVTPPVGVKVNVETTKDLGEALDRLRKEFEKAAPTRRPADAWPPRDHTGVPPHWMEGGKVTITC
ncbi:hypothetical protein CNECB9_2370111 [Cupriavidus necator]|uniref:Uncharacterized protein n=1 Tax=Cupriavidus necator TaxID=106590 RepID=A0A1K0IDY2_CUPNE|nr:hypothetical protein CNECB9_2370111 [Cupriavidus necator]